MTQQEAAWIRNHAWPAHIRRHLTSRPDRCSCTWGICHGCTQGQHHHCITGDGRTAPDAFVCSILDTEGRRAAVVVHLPRQKPCRLLCPCEHPSHVQRQAPPEPVQIGLFEAVAS